MPIVDAPFDFGRISATNALPDVYAMGGTLRSWRGPSSACRSASCLSRRAELQFEQVPILSEALPLAHQGVGPGAIDRNLASYGHEVEFPPRLENWQRRVPADAQTSGGLLVAVAHDEVLSCFQNALQSIEITRQGFDSHEKFCLKRY